MKLFLGSPFTIFVAIVFWWLVGGEMKSDGDELTEVFPDEEEQAHDVRT